MPVQRLDELVARHAGLERTGLEVGGNQGEGVVVRRARGRAGAEIMRQTHQALAADIFLGLLGDLALGKAGHGDWNAIGDPMAHAARRPAFRIEHQQRVALGAGGRIRPGQRRRNVLAHAIRILLVVAGVLGRKALTVLERRRRDREYALRIRALAAPCKDQGEARGNQNHSLAQHEVPPCGALSPIVSSLAARRSKAMTSRAVSRRRSGRSP